MNWNPKLRKYFNINEILTTNHVYKIFSQQNQETLLKVLNRILNHHNRRKKIFIVDATFVDLDFNFNRQKRMPQNTKFKMGLFILQRIFILDLKPHLS